MGVLILDLIYGKKEVAEKCCFCVCHAIDVFVFMIILGCLDPEILGHEHHMFLIV